MCAGGTLWTMTPPEARQHMAEGTLFRSGKRASILTLDEEEHADEDDADAMLTREVQEVEGDEADQEIS